MGIVRTGSTATARSWWREPGASERPRCAHCLSRLVSSRCPHGARPFITCASPVHYTGIHRGTLDRHLCISQVSPRCFQGMEPDAAIGAGGGGLVGTASSPDRDSSGVASRAMPAPCELAALPAEPGRRFSSPSTTRTGSLRAIRRRRQSVVVVRRWTLPDREVCQGF